MITPCALPDLRRLMLGFGALVATVLAHPALAQAGLPGQITIVRGALARDGTPWQMKGVKFVGRVTPDTALHNGTIGHDIQLAHNRFGPHLPDQVKAYGADTVSIAVSQYGLDATNAMYDPAYRAEVVDAIRLFRNAGLTVMICMQWERAAGAKGEPGSPTRVTLNAWTALLRALPRDDAGLVFDLFNEPSAMPSPDAFAQWQQQHNALIALVRQAGFHRQIVIASGLRGAEWLAGTPPLTDPDGKVAYGIHPELSVKQFAFATQAGWDNAFGNFCTRHICLATEWTLARRSPDPAHTGCGGDAPVLARTLLQYLWARHMGVVGWAFDIPGTLFTPDDPRRPTTLATWSGSCETSLQLYGNGQMLTDWFHTHPSG